MARNPRRPPRGIEWLKEFGYVPEEDFAAMLGVSVKTLKNRAHSDLPEFAKVGHRRGTVPASRAGILGEISGDRHGHLGVFGLTQSRSV